MAAKKKDDDDDNAYILCPRVGTCTPVKNSHIRECSKCHFPIYLSDSTLRSVPKDHAIVLVCMECVGTIKMGDVERPSPEQLAEIETALQRKLTKEEIDGVMGKVTKYIVSQKALRN